MANLEKNYNTFVLPEGVDEGDEIMNFQPPMEFNDNAKVLARPLGHNVLEQLGVEVADE